MTKTKGFTLIELLVVVTVLGILTVITMVNFQSANKRARDGRRQADLEEVRGALEIYRTDLGNYPASLPVPGQPLQNGSSIYLQSMPQDPLSAFSYSYTPGGSAPYQTYTLCAQLELVETAQSGCGDCGGTCTYKVTNP